ncbi:CHAT domain-containing protein [Streptomyces mirabilis]|uniref:CHAT domain-containing protein n=1 Tax=Streptomyces mirabilis TaxID=68239 RepID=UPI00368E5FF5
MADEAIPEPEMQTADVDRSAAEVGAGLIAPVTWLCPVCGLDAAVPAWVLLDMRQRPDLWPTARATVVCPECSAPAPQQPALVVTGIPTGVPLLVARDEGAGEPQVIRVCALNQLPPDGFDGLSQHAPMIHVSHAEAEFMLGSGELPPLHTQALEEALLVRRLQAALVAAISATSADGLAAAVDAHPELLSQAVLAEWQVHGVSEDAADQPRTPTQITMDQLPDTLLDDLPRMTAGEAWQRYVDRVAIAQRAFSDELEAEIAALESARERGEASRAMADRCVQLAEWVIPELFPGAAGALWLTRALMLISPLMSAPGDVEDAVGALEHAIELYEAADDPGAAAEARSNLVIALHTRPRERELNVERGITLLEELVVFWESLPDPARAALVRTNLAVALLDRKTGDPLDNARRALEECKTALLYRSRERNPVDYAFTLTNKAVAHSRLAESDQSHLLAAEQAYGEALDSLPPDAEAALRGRILLNYADLMTITASRRPEVREALARAESYARRAVHVHEEHNHTQELAFAQRLLARTLRYATTGDPIPSRLREARDLLFGSLQVLTPDRYPADCIATADEAVSVCQDLDDWQGASLASLTALAAWLASGGDTVGREDLPLPDAERDPILGELAHDSRFRFTAYTLFRAARQLLAGGAVPTAPEVQALLEQAVGIMEAGRATTLRAASGAEVRELQILRGIDPGLAEAYLSAVDKARGAAHTETPTPSESENDAHAGEIRLGAPAAGSGPSLEQLLETIRSLPGLSDFAQGQPPSMADLRAALQPGQAVVYLIAHPAGCCALVVTPPASPAAVVPVDLPTTNSARLLTLILGVGQRADGSPDGLTPGRPKASEALLAGLSSDFHFPRFRRVLRKVLAEIGRTMGQPLAHELVAIGVTDAVVVPCGLLPIFAWHAANWRARGRTTSLPDVLDTLSYAPSAGAWLAARKRVARLTEQPLFLVGLANPSDSQPPLPGAEAELRHVVTRFPDQRSAVAYGHEATGRFLLGQLSHATHLHLGCHGTMSYDSIDGASLTLAHAEQLDIARIRRLAGDHLRLVVVAACVSGAVNVILQPEESHALTIGFMHAGAAGVLGALWPIPDLPTALFITRFYEELTGGPGVEPALALARTQRWMRTLTSTDVRRYVTERPALSTLRGRGRLRGSVEAAAERRANLTRMRTVLRRRPFAAPEYWAAFVLNGC